MKKILKLLLAPLLIVLALIAWHFYSAGLSPEGLDQLDDFTTYVIIGVAILAGIGVVFFLFFNLFREIYTSGIMHRADKIIEVCIDEKNDYLYLETDCFQSAGDSGESYYTYHYYLFNLKTGHVYRYNAKNAKREPGKALALFGAKLPKPAPKFVRINSTTGNVLDVHQYKIDIRPFKTRFDFGFEITCRHKTGYNHCWKRKI